MLFDEYKNILIICIIIISNFISFTTQKFYRIAFLNASLDILKSNDEYLMLKVFQCGKSARFHALQTDIVVGWKHSHILIYISAIARKCSMVVKLLLCARKIEAEGRNGNFLGYALCQWVVCRRTGNTCYN